MSDIVSKPAVPLGPRPYANPVRLARMAAERPVWAEMHLRVSPDTVALIDDERTRYPTPTSRNEEVRRLIDDGLVFRRMMRTRVQNEPHAKRLRRRHERYDDLNVAVARKALRDQGVGRCERTGGRAAHLPCPLERQGKCASPTASSSSGSRTLRRAAALGA